LVVTSLTAPLAAQLPVGGDCDAATVSRLGEEEVGPDWTARQPDTVFAHMVDRITSDQWVFLADSLAVDFGHEIATMRDMDRDHLAGQLDTLRQELGFAQSQPDVSRRHGAAGLVRLTRFRLNRDPNEDRFYLFRGFEHEVAITDTLEQDTRRAICWRALAIDRLLSAFGETARGAVLRRLDAAALRWDNYGSQGQSQFPWELAVNSASFDRGGLDPPRRQFIVLHPAVGVELAGPSVGDLRRLDAVTLEPFGIVWYNQSRSFFYGASAVISFPADADVGFGGLLHLGRFAKAGFILRGRDEAGTSQNGVLLSLDLYRFVSKMPEAIRRAKEDALKLTRTQEIGWPPANAESGSRR
jgi:hypothetical protein